jgi:hypothetical protein
VYHGPTQRDPIDIFVVRNMSGCWRYARIILPLKKKAREITGDADGGRSEGIARGLRGSTL